MTNHHDILKAAVAGDAQAFQKLYALYATKVFNTALSYVQDHQAAEEITQDVFVKLHQKAADFRADSALGTWIYRITINTSLNHLKSKKRFRFYNFSAEEENKPDFEHPGVILEKKEEAKALFQVIKTLPEKQKTVFILSYMEALPRQEVADIMEISLKATESLLQRAKANLREKLKKRYPHRRK